MSLGTRDASPAEEVTMTDTAKTLRRLLSIGCVAGFTTVVTVQAQTHETAPAHDRMAMMANCQSMMAGMKANQDKLDDLVAKMNAATGQPKIEQMAAVLTELVAQQKAMRAHTMHMDRAPAAKTNTQQEQPPAGHEQHH
jgi:pyruvate/oxaloacetate carboxyltransferase